MSNNNTKTPAPLVIRLRSAEEKIVAAINATAREEELPCYLLEPIISKLHRQISDAAAREYAEAKKLSEPPTCGEAGGGDDGA